MATERQIEANRKNAEKCCGPKSVETKAISCMNALKTGIDCKSEVMRCESQAEYEGLISSFHIRFAPATPEEQSFVDALIRHEWLSRRYMCAEAAAWERRFNDWNSRSLGQVFLQESEKITRAGQLFNAARRAFSATLKQLRETQALRAKEQPRAPLPNRDCEVAAQQPSEPAQSSLPAGIANEPLKPKLDSFLTFPNPAPIAPAAERALAHPTLENGENDPPIAA